MATPYRLNPWPRGNEFYNFGTGIPTDQIHAECLVAKTIFKICAHFYRLWSMGAGSHEFNNLCSPSSINDNTSNFVKVTPIFSEKKL